ncbi:hypothetical protein ABMA27_008831 [Loxostege sticticalis]|uniref:Retrotransposon gag domain-containing protein n=1 Tax=Loxostege sticticalis TaxID=481309 RepID=A0ABR3H9H0_LOXSC
MGVNLSEEQFSQLLATLNNRRSTLASCKASFDGTKNSEVVEAFLAAVRIFKKNETISDADALDGLPLLLHGEATVWWQGVKGKTTSWSEFEKQLRENFAPRTPECLIYNEIISEKQGEQDTASFIARKRMLFSQLPTEEQFKEKQQMDLIYGLLHLKIRDKVPRDSVQSFEDLIRDAKGAEQVLMEKGNLDSIQKK